MQGPAQGRDRGAGRAGPRDGAPAGLRRAPHRPALGRTEAAGGPGPRGGARARGAAARRADGGPRPEAPQGDAGRGEEPPGAPPDHVRLRDPRPGRGAHHERPHRGDEPGPHRAGRHPRGALRAAAHALRGRLPGGARTSSRPRWTRSRRASPRLRTRGRARPSLAADDGGYAAGAAVCDRRAARADQPGRRRDRRPQRPAPAGLDDEIYLGDRTDWRVRLGAETPDRGRGRGRGARSAARRSRCTVSLPPSAVLRLEEREPPSACRTHRRARRRVLLLVPCLLVLRLLFAAAPGADVRGVARPALGLRRRRSTTWSARQLRRARSSRSTCGSSPRSFGLAFVTTVLCLLVAYPVAYWLGLRAPARWRSALLVLVILPFWTSFLVRMYAWIFMLRTEGLVNLVLGHFGVPPLPLLYNDFAVLLGQVYGELPFMILPLYASIEKLDRSLLEAAADLGAAPVAGPLARHDSAHRSRHRRRLRPRLHPVARRVPRPRPAGRRAHRLRRQPDPEPVRGGPRHARSAPRSRSCCRCGARCCSTSSAARCAPRRKPEMAGDASRRPVPWPRPLEPRGLPVSLRAAPGAGRLLVQPGRLTASWEGFTARLVRASSSTTRRCSRRSATA